MHAGSKAGESGGTDLVAFFDFLAYKRFHAPQMGVNGLKSVGVRHENPMPPKYDRPRPSIPPPRPWPPPALRARR